MRAAVSAAVAFGAAAVALSCCSVPTNETAQMINPSELPESLRPGVTPSTTIETGPLARAEDHTVYLLTTPQNTERTIAVAVKRQVHPDKALNDVLSTLFGKSTTPEEQTKGYFNTLELFGMTTLNINKDVVTVDIAPLSAEDTPPPDTLKLAAVQLVFTISAWGVDGTRILLNGEEVSIPTSDADAEPGSVLRVSAYEQFQEQIQPNLGTDPVVPAASGVPGPQDDEDPPAIPSPQDDEDPPAIPSPQDDEDPPAIPSPQDDEDPPADE